MDSLIYNLTPAITIGDLSHNITVSALKLISISINYEDVYVKDGTAVLSLCLADPITGYPLNVVYQDASALDMAKVIEGQIGAELFEKLIGDGKLPTGTLSTVTVSPAV